MLEKSSAVTLQWTDGVATVAVRGELGSHSSAEARERIASLADHGPQSLVLDLVGVDEGFAAESLALIAVARYLLPSGCVLDVRSASPEVRQILRLADSSGLESGAGTGGPGPEPGT